MGPVQAPYRSPPGVKVGNFHGEINQEHNRPLAKLGRMFISGLRPYVQELMMLSKMIMLMPPKTALTRR